MIYISFVSLAIFILCNSRNYQNENITLSREYVSVPPSVVPSLESTYLGAKYASFDISRYLENHWSLVFFGYTKCPTVCPLSLSRLSSFYRSLNFKDKSSVQIVFISLDSDESSQEVDDYLKSYQAPIKGFSSQNKDLTSFLKFFSADGPKIEMHATSVFLVNPNREYIGHFTRVLSVDAMKRWFVNVKK
ncbi:MAG: SCO family protein [Oligoflexales bacterium]